MMNPLEQSFIHAVEKNRLAHAYIFEGVKGVGKRNLALFIAQLLFCTNRQEGYAPCQECAHCIRVKDGNYPDLIEVYPDGSTIKVEQMRQLKQQLSKKAMESNTKICLLHDVDTLTSGAANSLLKFLEEPDGSIVFFLLTTQLSRVLPTIQSRCQIIRFQTPTTAAVQKQLLEKGVVSSNAMIASALASNSDQAYRLATDEAFQTLRQESWQWFVRLFQNRNRGFVTIQSQLLPLVTNREQTQRLLELLLLNVRDALCVAMGVKEAVIQQDRLSILEDIAHRYSMKQWITIHETIIEMFSKIQANVGIQAALEQWVLRLPKE